MAKQTVPQITGGLVRIDEAADFLRLSKACVYKLICSGDIPSRRFGRTVRIPSAWLSAQAEIRDGELQQNGEVPR